MQTQTKPAMKGKKLSKTTRLVLRGLPLAGAAVSSLVPLGRFGQQFLVLIMLIWVQVFFVLEVFLAGK